MTQKPRHPDHPVAALIAPDILALLTDAPQNVAAETDEMHPADLADVAEALPPGRVAEFLRVLPAARAADVLEYLDEELRYTVLEAMSSEQAAQLVGEMTPDDRADVLEELEDDTADEILSDMPAAARKETERLLQFEADSAGGIMTTEFVAVALHLTAEEALAQVRALARAGRKEAMYAVYVQDADGVLVGVLSLRELLAAPEGVRVADIMATDVVSVNTSADRGEVARITREYDLVAVPVVDGFNSVVGVVTVDDVIDAMEEEQTEDVQRLGAVQPLEEPYITAGFWRIARKRVGWLVILFVGEMFTGTAMRHYESTLAAAISLTLFIPLIISSGGNSGSQSATLITRALAVGDVEVSDALRVLWRELGQGLVLGACLGAIGLARVLLWGNGGAVATVVAISLVAVVLIGAVAGSMLPLLFQRLGFDPAVASSPFVASLVDVTGLVIYFTVARTILSLP